jgi:hypothetical protein
MSPVGTAALLHGLVHLDVADEQAVNVQTLHLDSTAQNEGEGSSSSSSSSSRISSEGEGWTLRDCVKK